MKANRFLKLWVAIFVSYFTSLPSNQGQVDGFLPLKHSCHCDGRVYLNKPRNENLENQYKSCSGSKRTFTAINAYNRKDDEQDYDQTGEVGKGPNWIEKSFPVDTTGSERIDPKQVDDYNLGISGISFQTGPLGRRMFEAIMSKTSLEMSPEISQAFRLYAMDFTAKEATRAALKQNGLDMVLQEEDEDQGMWGDVDTVRLIDTNTGVPFSKIYDSLEEAVKDWEPGQAFDFVVRQVPAKMRELSVDELLQALDPDGKLREEAKQAEKQEENGTSDDNRSKSKVSEEAVSAIFDDDIVSLADLATDNMRRARNSPEEPTLIGDVFSGLNTRGYSLIRRSDLLQDSINDDGTESHATTMHVMNALVSHGVVVVDITDGGLSDLGDAKKMADMWKAVQKFYSRLDDDETLEKKLPALETVKGAASQHAKVGYISHNNGSMRFFETRRERKTGKLLPDDEMTNELLGEEGIKALEDAFDLVASIGKDVVRIAAAASNVEHGAFVDEKQKDQKILERDQRIRASQAATLLADELVDDGKPLRATAKIDHLEGSVSMSPHRLCSYVDKEFASREVFGAHTDSTFVTIAPVTNVCGLEVYDETEERWYQPERKARQHWEEEKKSRGEDHTALTETIETDDGTTIEIPWHSRYVSIMAGEYLQLATRNEVPATVHRVIAMKDGPMRFSAPILLRGRPGTKFSVKRYCGDALGNSVLLECDGMTMDEIHDATQPQAFQ